jgi:hypothetical protein
MNNYEHVILFENSNGSDNGYYTAKAKHDVLHAQIGDHWRILVPKSVTYGLDERWLDVALLSNACDQDQAIFPIGKIRSQESEKYVDLTLWVGSLPSSEIHKQFALVRENGQRIIGTFKGQQNNLSAYMEALKQFYESYPHTKVLCDVDGSKMRVRIWEKSNVFMLADEKLTVGLGSAEETNDNFPLFSRIPQGRVEYPRRDAYKLNVGGSVQEGNVFKLGTRTLIATNGDNAESIYTKLLGAEDRYIVPHNSGVTVSTESGSRTINNTNQIDVQAVFVDTNAELDQFYIRISGSVQPGNIIQVSATGKPTRGYKVSLSDTVQTIESYFNSDANGYYVVDEGVIPLVSFLSGTQRIQNSNTPSLSLSDLTMIEAYQANKWQIIVGPDIRPGNIYRLQDREYIAKQGDTDLSVANYFGFDSVSFAIETPISEIPIVYATKGYKFNQSNIADITITEGPKLARSAQAVLEMEFSCEIPEGRYQLAILNSKYDTPEVIGVGNFITVKHHAIGELVEAGDSGDVFGFEYYEEGLVQRMRLPVFVSPPKQQSEEERLTKFMGGYDRTVTKREFVSKLVTRAGHLPMHVTIASFLKHRYLRIGDKEYYNSGEYAEEHLVVGSDLRQAHSDITEVGREKNNFFRYRSNHYPSGAYGGFCKVLGEGVMGRLKLWMRNAQIVREIRDWQLLNTGSYQIIAESFEDLKLDVYENGVHLFSANIPKGNRVKINDHIRFQTGSCWILKVSLLSSCLHPIVSYKCEHMSNLNLIYACEKMENVSYDEFSDDHNFDFNI